KIEKAIEFVWKIAKKKSIVFIISDFFDTGYEHSLKILSKKHDVVAFRIIDPTEIELPDAGIIHMQDPETGKTITINSSSNQFRDSFQKYISQQNNEIEKRFKRMKIDFLTIKTNEEYIKNLIKFFKNRVKRLKRG
ncbi:MAG TPA: DUF58 domain-containing protein, partial [Candidatus Cloacimonadota bacterium]|nr:DUF58 domain-containing protein [Candidatus Cloacimonadota bacterium]